MPSDPSRPPRAPTPTTRRLPAETPGAAKAPKTDNVPAKAGKAPAKPARSSAEKPAAKKPAAKKPAAKKPTAKRPTAKKPAAKKPANVESILAGLERVIPEPRCELDHHDAFELLIATQLSAQSTDAMVNKVTPELFRRWPDARALAAAEPAEFEAVLRPTGFFRQKTRNAQRTAAILVERFGGEVPATMEGLLQLPGVARKTANVVLGTAFGIQSGVTVDTHMFRVTRRWGWHDEKTPEKVEPILMRLVPQAGWSDFSHRGVLFGRYHCLARAPKCAGCALAEACPVGRGEAAP